MSGCPLTPGVAGTPTAAGSGRKASSPRGVKRLVALGMACVMACLCCMAQTVKWVGCTPENNSEIKSFDFVFNFDVADAIASLGAGEFGLGCQSGTSRFASLYEGDQETGELLGKALTTNITGASEEFEVNGNQIKFSFPADLIPQAGKTYTLVVTNNFTIYQKGKKVAKGTTTLKYETNPLVLTFKGAAASAEELNLSEVSISNNQQMEVLDRLTYSFSNPIELSDGASVLIKQGDAVVKTLPLTLVDETTAGAVIDSPIELINKQVYEVALPAGAVVLKSNPSVCNKAISLNVEGTYTRTVALKSATPAEGACGLFPAATAYFDLPQGVTLKSGGSEQAYYLKMSLYKDEVAEGNLVKELLGELVDTDDGIKWNLNQISFEPATNYVLHMPADYLRFYNLENKMIFDCANSEVRISFSTPTVQESGLPPMEFQEPVMGEHGKDAVLSPGEKVEYVRCLEIALNDLKYDYNGTLSTLWVTPESKFYVYDVTDGTEKLIKESVVTLQTRETTVSYYSVVNLTVHQTFFSGHKYRIVIPEGQVTVSSAMIRNYVKNAEWSIDFEGSAPTEARVVSCTIRDNAEMSALPVVIWEFEGAFENNPELSAILRSTWEFKGMPMEANSRRTTMVSKLNNLTQVVMINYDAKTGGAYPLSTERAYEVILPEGILYYAADPSVKNSELRYTLKPVEPQTAVKTEFVNLTVTVNDLVTASQTVVKDEPVAISLTPGADWKVAELTRNGSSVIDFLEGNTYETPALTEDTEIRARVEYDGRWAVESTTGVWEIADRGISIKAESGRIVVSGVTADNTIMIHGVNGVLIKTVKPEAGAEIVTITVEPGHVYIVTVDGVAAKLQP